jgi:hypothetical protein
MPLKKVIDRPRQGADTELPPHNVRVSAIRFDREIVLVAEF